LFHTDESVWRVELKRLFAIIAIVLTTLTTLLFCTALICVNSNYVHQTALSRVNTLIPGTITVGNIHISLLAMKLEINELAVADSSGRKLAGFKRLFVDISPGALIHHKLIIQDALIDNPWVIFNTDTTGQFTLLNALVKTDTTTLKTVKKTRGASKPFQIELRKCSIHGGSTLFSALGDSTKIQVHGLSLNVNGETGTMSANLGISTDSISLEKSGKTICVRDFALMTKVRSMNVDTMNLRLRTAASSLSLSGNASSLTKNPFVNMTLTADLGLSDIQTILPLKEMFSGSSHIVMHVKGNAANPVMQLKLAYDGGEIRGYPVKSLMLDVLLTDRLIAIKPLQVRTPDGSVDITGSVDMKGVFPDGLLKPVQSLQMMKYNLEISANGVDLNGLAGGVTGVASVTMAVNGQGIIPESLDADCKLAAHVNKLKLDTSKATVDAALACTVSVTDGTVHLEKLTGQIGNTTLEVSGLYNLSKETVDAAIKLVVPDFSLLTEFVGIDSVNGSAALTVNASGELKNPQILVRLNADSIATKQVRAGNVTFAGELDKKGVAHVNELLLVNNHSTVKITSSAKVVHDGKPLKPESIAFDASISTENMVIEDFIDSIRGAVKLDANVSGTVNDPKGQVKLAVNDLTAAGQKIREIILDANISDKRININPLRIGLAPEEELQLYGWASMKDSLNLAVSSKGIQLQSVNAVHKADSSMSGIALIDLNASGTYTDPHANGTIGIKNITMGNLSFDDVGLNIDLHDHNVKLEGKALGDIQAAYNIDTKAFSADLFINNILLKPFLALSGMNLDGTVTAAFKASGNADTLAGIKASMDIKNLTIGYNGTEVLKTDNLNATFENNRYAIPDLKIKLADNGYINGHAGGLLDGPHDISLDGNVPLSVARHFSDNLPDVIEGSIGINAYFRGMVKDPDLRAQIELKNVGMSIPSLSEPLHSLNGKISADKRSVRIESLQGKIDKGTINASGEIKLDNLKLSDLTADVKLNKLPVNLPDMLDIVVDGDMHVSGNPDKVNVTGDIAMLDGLYYQDIVISPFSGMGQRKRKVQTPPPENTTPYLKNMHLDVGIQVRAPFNVDNNMAQLAIIPDLQLMGTLQAPALEGRADVKEGTITYQKKVFTVEKGVVNFVNPYAIEPEIEISGTIPVREWIIKIEISGTPEDLVFRLSSDGSGLEDQDLLSLLVLGKTTAELQNDMQNRGEGINSQQMIASLVASTFGDDIKKATGLDILEIETGDNTNGNSDRIAVTMGKQLTKRFGTRYTVESKDGKVVQRATAEYRILQNLNIAGFQDTKGIFGTELRLIWEK
jgi:autotransporter translocation and assembly factor TamB